MKKQKKQTLKVKTTVKAGTFTPFFDIIWEPPPKTAAERLRAASTTGTKGAAG